MDQKRKIAYDVLMDVELRGTYSNLALNRHMDEGFEYSAFVRELVYGVLENKMYLDYFLDSIIKKGVKSCRKNLLVLLRMGVYQIEFMESVPEYTAVDETVDIAKKIAPGTEKFINAVLRNYIRRRRMISLPQRSDDPVRYLSVLYSINPDLVRMFISMYGEEDSEKILSFSKGRPPVSIRANLMKTNVENLEKKLHDGGMETVRSDLSDRVLMLKGSGIADSPFYKAGDYTIMSEESCFIADETKVKPGNTVIDLCAAPGGKTGAMAEMANDEAKIIAMDIHPHRVKLIKKEAERLGLKSIKPIEGNAGTFRREFAGIADKVLCDVPCSGLGVIRRKPELKYIDIKNNFTELRRLQMAILDQATKYVKPGADIIYSTCTLNKSENTDLISEFIRRHRDFGIIKERLISPFEDEKDGFYLAVLRSK
jgi:16S rRNA (cytosine967-C5)-methyltransferase